MSRWICQKCGSYRTLEVTKGGAPACMTDGSPMIEAPEAAALPTPELPAQTSALAAQLEQRDPDLAQEPELDSDEVVDPKDLLTIREINEQ